MIKHADSVTLGGNSVFQRLWAAYAWYWLGLVPVLAGVSFGVDVLPRQFVPVHNEPGVLHGFAAWDGWWYSRIVEDGYSFEPQKASTVAFFPGYPLVARLLQRGTGLAVAWCLVIVTHLCLMAILALIPIYERSRAECVSSPERLLTVLALVVWPMGLFLRMAYSESLFVFLVILTFLGISRRWPAWVVAAIAGAATGTRIVGIALLPPLLWQWWKNSSTKTSFFAKVSLLTPASLWGLLSYMLYLHFAFGDAFAFAEAHQDWVVRRDLPFPDRFWSLATLEPVWSVYVPSSEAYWARYDKVGNPLFSLHFWNPIYFVACAVLIAIGAWKRWLSVPEVLLSVGLLLIPYLTHSYREVFMAHGRYAASVFPMYRVLGHLAARMPPDVLALVAAILTVKLALFSALFAAWYRII